jgi:glycerol-3-phosphate dehydrogenase
VVQTESAVLDVVVIGGGVNGTGVARDAALRGLSVALFEKNDIGFGASGNNSGLIHGGPRYMLHDPRVTRTSCLDSGHIQRIAPHLLFRVPFVMPVSKRAGSRLQLHLLDSFFAVYDRYQPLKAGKPHTLLDAGALHAVEPGLVGEFEGAVTFDEWGIDGVRLCIANALDARVHGASIHVPAAVIGLVRSPDGRVEGVEYQDGVTGERGSVRARAVVNATGAWAPLLGSIGKLPPEALRLRPGKGIHVYFDRRLSNSAIVTQAVDGRQIFVLPWQNTSAIATTDDDFYGDLDRPRVTSDEARYLVEGIARVFPAVSEARAIGTWVGVRPTLFEWGKPADALSREHRVVDHRADGAAGLYSMLGGKLASYRLFAEEATDLVAAALSNREPCRTHLSPLPGGEDSRPAQRAIAESPIGPLAGARLLYRHGSNASALADACSEAPHLAELACACEPVTWAEVDHAVLHEWAVDVHGVARRTRLGLGSCGGLRCAAACGARVAALRGLQPSAGRDMARDFLERQAELRLPVLGSTQLRQEALLEAELRAHYGSEGGA